MTDNPRRDFGLYSEHRGEKSCQTGRPITTKLSYCFGYPVKRLRGRGQ